MVSEPKSFAIILRCYALDNAFLESTLPAAHVVELQFLEYIDFITTLNVINSIVK